MSSLDHPSLIDARISIGNQFLVVEMLGQWLSVFLISVDITTQCNVTSSLFPQNV